MWSHDAVWRAIDSLAERHGFSASGLARKSGLDPTSFNPSKRHGIDGRPRWPSTESIDKVLTATGETLQDFVGAVMPAGRRGARAASLTRRRLPLLGFAKAGVGGFFDEAGFPAGEGWDEATLPGISDEGAYALEVSGDSMMPAYRDGDILIVSPAARVRRGDRVVVRTASGEVMAKVLKRKTEAELQLVSLNPDHADRFVPVGEVDWMARILWASQ